MMFSLPIPQDIAHVSYSIARGMLFDIEESSKYGVNSAEKVRSNPQTSATNTASDISLDL